jgi:hypothetical protein
VNDKIDALLDDFLKPSNMRVHLTCPTVEAPPSFDAPDSDDSAEPEFQVRSLTLLALLVQSTCFTRTTRLCYQYKNSNTDAPDCQEASAAQQATAEAAGGGEEGEEVKGRECHAGAAVGGEREGVAAGEGLWHVEPWLGTRYQLATYSNSI